MDHDDQITMGEEKEENIVEKSWALSIRKVLYLLFIAWDCWDASQLQSIIIL